jgi:hypothetical protein
MRRFSLRTLMLVTAALAVLCAIPMRRASLQHRSRAWVCGEGGHVTFAHKWNPESSSYDHDAELPVPAWLVNLFGIDLFDSVNAVILDNQVVDDLTPLTNFPDLRSLAILIEIDEKLDFSPLAKLGGLEELHLDYTGISAERLAKLRALLPGLGLSRLIIRRPERTDGTFAQEMRRSRNVISLPSLSA